MYTLGFAFKPWLAAKAIADGPAILDYVIETAREHGIDRHIRFHHHVVRAAWSSERALWTVEVERRVLSPATLETVAKELPTSLDRGGIVARQAAKTLLLPGEMGERFKLLLLTRGVAWSLPGRDLRSRL